MNARIIESPRKRLQQLAEPAEAWLWCSECERFMQYGSLSESGGCPFTGCCGTFGFDLFFWDDMREPEDPRWPSSPDELEHGMRSPEMESFYAAQLASRIAGCIATFEASPERAVLGDAPLRYLEPFLQMMSDLEWDLTRASDAPFSADLALMLLGDLPVWSRTADEDEAPRMEQELCAFFRFAARTGAVADARSWLDELEADDVVGRFRFSMRNDRRLRPTRGVFRPKARPSRRKHKRKKPRRRKR